MWEGNKFYLDFSNESEKSFQMLSAALMAVIGNKTFNVV